MIVAAAIKHGNGLICSVPAPGRHNDVGNRIYDLTGESYNRGTWTQGFLTDQGEFLDRYEAAQHVKNYDQEITDRSKQENGGREITELFSEDLW